MLGGELGELQRNLRTQEARGCGTDVRLVLIEAGTVSALLTELDARVAEPDLHDASLDDAGAFARLAEEWADYELQEVTTRLREIADLLELLLYGGDKDRRRRPRGSRT